MNLIVRSALATLDPSRIYSNNFVLLLIISLLPSFTENVLMAAMGIDTNVNIN